MSDIPEPRSDTLCADCESAKAVTQDHRFCLKCLRARIRHDAPGSVKRAPCRGPGKEQAYMGDQDMGGYRTNAVRLLEDR